MARQVTMKNVSLSTLRRAAKKLELDVDVRRPEKHARRWSIDVVGDDGVVTVSVYYGRKQAAVNAAYAALRALS